MAMSWGGRIKKVTVQVMVESNASHNFLSRKGVVALDLRVYGE